MKYYETPKDNIRHNGIFSYHIQVSMCWLMEKLSDMLEEAGASVSSEGDSQELNAYLAEPQITFGRESCYSLWAKWFPYLSKVEQRYICAPPTSVASERLFSWAGDVYNKVG